MRTLTLLATFSLLFVTPGFADQTSDVRKFAKEKIDLVIELLKDEKISKEERNKKIVAVVDPMFDFPRMAKLSLGKKNWKGMTRAQRKEFSAIFVVRLKESYLEKLDLYTDEKVVVEEAKQVKKRIHVLTRLVSKDDKKDMVYKFYKSKKGWKVYDVVILGVSVVQTYRSQFNGFLKSGTYAQLLTKLRTSGGFTIPTAAGAGS